MPLVISCHYYSYRDLSYCGVVFRIAMWRSLLQEEKYHLPRRAPPIVVEDPSSTIILVGLVVDRKIMFPFQQPSNAMNLGKSW
jgi:hypothetical protein